ncbi:U3 snoRNP component Utp13p-like protein [Galdieria sulphuraria]|uniref:U3 snoRNP component Utp13p-like protein n=1 Tax=Galdieria sulphuraria TaxID=130081 RepID=M2W9M9_GALSU|nr:U3 snoRNP component Utp13p-like protein [Galdieria sulphuraria]EME32611.1 U3 snoRNP component Utp13p-like protein [Galdieria sulphuraria]|eukprot:XP_005709131.1 U3 snoRNP component Utp13p-like protein [Galdieria sulphuraria]
MDSQLSKPRPTKLHIRKLFTRRDALQPTYISRGISVSSVYTFEEDSREVLYPTLVTTVTTQAFLVRWNGNQVLVPVACFAEQNDVISSVCVSHSGSKVAVAYRSSLVALYSVPNEFRRSSLESRTSLLDQLPVIRQERSWKPIAGNIIVQLAFDFSDTFLVTATTDGKVKIWDVEEGHITHSLKTGAAITKTAFHPRVGQLELFLSLDDGRLLVYDLPTRNFSKTFQCNQGAIVSFDFLSNGNFVVFSVYDNTLHLFRTTDMTAMKHISVDNSITTITALPIMNEQTDFQIFTTSSISGRLTFWRFSMQEQPKIYKSKELLLSELYGAVESIYVSLSSQVYLFVGMENDMLHVVDTTKMEITTSVVGNLDEVYDICFLSESKRIAVASNSEDVYIFDGNLDYKSIVLTGHTESVLSLDYDPLTQVLVTASRDKTCRLYKLNDLDALFESDKLETLGCFAIALGHDGPIGAVSIARTNHTDSFIVSGAADHTLKLWKFNTNWNGEIRQLSASWTVSAHQKDINCVAISPDFDIIVSTSQDKTARMWSSRDGKPIATCIGHKRGVWHVSFSPVDRIFATSSGDCTIRIWSARDGACLQLLEGSSSSLLRVLFLQAGSELASGGSDGLLKIWNVKSGECISTMEAHDDRLWCLTCILDGELIASGGADGRILFWKDITLEKEMEEMESKKDWILKQQDLENAMKRKEWQTVFSMSFRVRSAI